MFEFMLIEAFKSLFDDELEDSLVLELLTGIVLLFSLLFRLAVSTFMWSSWFVFGLLLYSLSSSFIIEFKLLLLLLLFVLFDLFLSDELPDDIDDNDKRWSIVTAGDVVILCNRVEVNCSFSGCSLLFAGSFCKLNVLLFIDVLSWLSDELAGLVWLVALIVVSSSLFGLASGKIVFSDVGFLLDSDVEG